MTLRRLFNSNGRITTASGSWFPQQKEITVMTSSVDYIRCLMDQHVHIDESLSDWTQHRTNRQKREKERSLCQVVLSVKFNGTSQKGWVTSKATLNSGLFIFLQIKDKLSSSLNLATDCFSLCWIKKKGWFILYSYHCHVGQCQWIRCNTY